MILFSYLEGHEYPRSTIQNQNTLHYFTSGFLEDKSIKETANPKQCESKSVLIA